MNGLAGTDIRAGEGGVRAELTGRLLVALLALAALWVFRGDVSEMLARWFDDGSYFHKGPILWLLGFFYLLRDVSPERLFIRRADASDLLLALVTLLLMVLVEDRVPMLMPIAVIALIRHYSIKSDTHPNFFVLFCLLAFSLPYFPLLVPYLQSMAVFVVEGILGLFGIPVLVQENYIAIPRGQFFVAGSCSGFRYLANNLILFFLYALFSRFNTRQFLMALGITILLALLVNWVRIFIIIFVAHNWGLDVPFFVKDHGNLGWVIYIFMLIPFFYGFLRIDRMRLGTPKALQFLRREWLPFAPQWLLLPVFAWSLFR